MEVVMVRMVTGLWLALTAIQFTVWMLACVIGGHLVNPWWLWTAAAGGVVVAGLRVRGAR
jgi:hypothetical protein